MYGWFPKCIKIASEQGSQSAIADKKTYFKMAPAPSVAFTLMVVIMGAR